MKISLDYGKGGKRDQKLKNLMGALFRGKEGTYYEKVTNSQ